ncbi:hypothetical protein K7X08_014771 [Anisodus acutangulus]|uniref:Mechanosensitive ion channel protein n=1 Tax=Anisodus acutangulus TaxID=402998 RepID=A0A9Q1LIV6_9SOLA|nr:hypothetical protein K7X08_014771 [Anisodus acutangulus]
MGSPAMDTTDTKEVVLKSNTAHKETELSSSTTSKTNGTRDKIYRDSSYDFSNDAAMKRMQDNKDFDFITESPYSQPSPLSRVEESPPNNHGVLTRREVRVSFNENRNNGDGSVRRRSNLSTTGPGLQDEVLLCSSRKSSNLLTKTFTKSRLMDPPEQSQTITMKSGVLGKSSEFDDDDPFSDEDLPEEYKKMKFNLFSFLQMTLLVKVLAMSFHVTAFFDRIQEALFTQYVIETLSGPPLVEIRMEQEEEEKVMAEVQKLQSAGATLPPDLKASIFPKRPIGTPRKSTAAATPRSPVFSRSTSTRKEKEEEEGGITIDHLHRLNQKNVSAWNMKRLINIVRKGVLSTLDEQLQQSGGDDEASVEITSEKQAKFAAKKVFNNVAKPDSKFIYLDDIMRFMREDEALKTMQLFEGGNEAKGISKRTLKNWVVNAFRERRALALSLNDTKTAVNKLHHMLNVLVGVIILVVWLLILKVATTHFLVFMSSQVLLVVFMFGNTAKTTFEAIIFLFVMHPFVVGDRVEIEGTHMVVEEMNILTTVFLRYDNLKIVYPNSVLSTKPISNYYRSPDMGDAIEFCIHISTPMEKIASMKEKITRYIENKSDHWYPAPMIVMRDVEDLNRIKWSVWISHTMNFQDMGERWARRALLVEEMVKIFRELDIEYRMLPVDVNVRNMPPLTTSRVPSNWSICA